MKRIAVGDIMTRNFVSAKPSDNLLSCAKLMVKNRVDSLLLTEKHKLIGILTSRDVLWTVTKKPGIDLSKMKAIEIATRKVAVIKPSADMSDALRKMRTLNFRRLPVLSRGEVIGILTLKDILRIDPSLYNQLGELAEIKEEARKLKHASEDWPLEGFCENCGTFTELLHVEGKSLCSDCRNELY